MAIYKYLRSVQKTTIKNSVPLYSSRNKSVILRNGWAVCDDMYNFRGG